MARRFYNVLRGYRGAAARQKYLDHLAGLGTQGENLGTRGNRPDFKKIYIEPFAGDLPAGILFFATALDPAWTALKSPIGTRAKETTTDAAAVIKVSGFKAARVVRRTKDATGVATTSKLTGLKYLKYNSTSASAPFGRNSATDTQLSAQTAIKNAVGATFNVTFIQEKM